MKERMSIDRINTHKDIPGMINSRRDKGTLIVQSPNGLLLIKSWTERSVTQSSPGVNWSLQGTGCCLAGASEAALEACPRGRWHLTMPYEFRHAGQHRCEVMQCDVLYVVQHLKIG